MFSDQTPGFVVFSLIANSLARFLRVVFTCLGISLIESYSEMKTGLVLEVYYFNSLFSFVPWLSSERGGLLCKFSIFCISYK